MGDGGVGTGAAGAERGAMEEGRVGYNRTSSEVLLRVRFLPLGRLEKVN